MLTDIKVLVVAGAVGVILGTIYKKVAKLIKIGESEKAYKELMRRSITFMFSFAVITYGGLVLLIAANSAINNIGAPLLSCIPIALASTACIAYFHAESIETIRKKERTLKISENFLIAFFIYSGVYCLYVAMEIDVLIRLAS